MRAKALQDLDLVSVLRPESLTPATLEDGVLTIHGTDIDDNAKLGRIFAEKLNQADSVPEVCRALCEAIVAIGFLMPGRRTSGVRPWNSAAA